jgi:hypothetical protein
MEGLTEPPSIISHIPSVRITSPKCPQEHEGLVSV